MRMQPFIEVLTSTYQYIAPSIHCTTNPTEKEKILEFSSLFVKPVKLQRWSAQQLLKQVIAVRSHSEWCKLGFNQTQGCHWSGKIQGQGKVWEF